MSQNQHPRLWRIIAAIAMVISLVLLLIPHVHDSGSTITYFLFLPILFIGLIEPFSIQLRLVWMRTAFVPEAPVLAASFQRPPPREIA